MKNSDAVLITGRLSKERVKDTDNFANMRGISRSQVVADAVNFYLGAKECIKCGALNNPEGKKCAVCGTKLYSDEELHIIVNRFLESEVISGLPWAHTFIENHFPERAEYLEKFLEKGYQPHFSFFIDRKSGKTKYCIRLTFRDGELDFTPTDENIQIELDSDTLLSFMASEVASDVKSGLAQKKKED